MRAATTSRGQMRQQLTNFTYGILDYAAYPIGMLIVAPFILRNLGIAQYGVWTVTVSVVNIGSVVASGFGDASTQRIASRISAGNREGIASVVRAAMGIHLVLGLLSAIAIWCLAPLLADRLAMHDIALRGTCAGSIRLAAAITALRAMETVCISTQKAFQRYGPALRVSIAGRLLTLATAATLASRGEGVIELMAASLIVMAATLGIQAVGLHRLVKGPLTPAYEETLSNDLLRFGAFTWLIAATGVAFSQADRLVGGASVGAAAIVSYALCAQLCQPVYGVTAAGLHFFFPYLASRRAEGDGAAITRALLLSLAANAVLVLIGAGSLLGVGYRLLRMLANDELARTSAPLLPCVLAGTALLALSVTGSYAMVALGKARTVAMVNTAGCLAMVLSTAALLRENGALALADGRIAFALIALCIYIPLFKEARRLTVPLPYFATGETVEEV